MIVEPSPAFSAAGDFLAALYSLNFTTDLTHSIPVEGTWQGDRKRAASIYFNNYANNFVITVSNGSNEIQVPAYSSGYVDLAGFNDIKIVADGVGDVKATLSTQPRQTGFSARGNAPSTASVSVVDGGKFRTNSGTSCVGYAYCGPGAGVNSHVQMFNRINSGVNMYIGQIGFFSSGTVSNGIGFGRFDTPLVSFINNGTRKMLGSSASLAEFRTGGNATPLLSGGNLGTMGKNLPLLKFIEPIEIRPGYGFVIYNVLTGEDIGGSFEYFEESVLL